MPEATSSLEVQVLPDGVDRSHLACGVPALDDYIRRQAGQDRKRGVAVTHVALDTTGTLVGYYTLSAFSLSAWRTFD